MIKTIIRLLFLTLIFFSSFCKAENSYLFIPVSRRQNYQFEIIIFSPRLLFSVVRKVENRPWKIKRNLARGVNSDRQRNSTKGDGSSSDDCRLELFSTSKKDSTRETRRVFDLSRLDTRLFACSCWWLFRLFFFFFSIFFPLLFY